MPVNAVSIDAKHLDRQTMGDRELQLEILKLYRHQARLFLCRLETVTTAQELREITHTLKGASLGVGAQAVAQATKVMEDAARTALENNSTITHIDRRPVIDAVNAVLESIQEITAQEH